MFGILDRYIIRKFLGTFFFILVLIMAIAVVFDASEKTEDFANMSATWQEVMVQYYLNFVVYYANLFSGLLIFIAVILFTSKMAQRTEVIAILSAGVGFKRFLWPYFLAATFLTLVALVVSHSLLPRANKVRLAFEENHIRVAFRVDDHNLHREIEPGVIAYFESFNMQQQTGYRFSLERWENNELKWKMISDRAKYDSLSNRWTVHDLYERTLLGDKELIRRRPILDTTFSLVPEDLGRRDNAATSMTTAELNKFIENERAQGGDEVPFALLEKYQRTAFPFATYVFTLIGVSLASRKVRGGTGVHIALGVLIILTYIFTMKITTVAATNAGLSAAIAVWLPNVIFLLVGIYIYRTAPK